MVVCEQCVVGIVMNKSNRSVCCTSRRTTQPYRACYIYICIRSRCTHYIIAMSPNGVYLMCRETASTVAANAINKQMAKKKHTSVYSHLGHLHKLYVCGAKMLNKHRIEWQWALTCWWKDFCYHSIFSLPRVNEINDSPVRCTKRQQKIFQFFLRRKINFSTNPSHMHNICD